MTMGTLVRIKGSETKYVTVTYGLLPNEKDGPRKIKRAAYIAVFGNEEKEADDLNFNLDDYCEIVPQIEPAFTCDLDGNRVSSEVW